MRLLGIGYGKSSTSILAAVGLDMFGCVLLFVVEIPSLIHTSRFPPRLRLFERKLHDSQPYSLLPFWDRLCFMSGTPIGPQPSTVVRMVLDVAQEPPGSSEQAASMAARIGTIDGKVPQRLEGLWGH